MKDSCQNKTFNIQISRFFCTMFHLKQRLIRGKLLQLKICTSLLFLSKFSTGYKLCSKSIFATLRTREPAIHIF